MKIEQTHTGDTEVKIMYDTTGQAYMRIDDIITVLRAWANANKEQVALMGLLREIIKIRNKHKKSK